MQWSEEAIILSAKRFGESGLLVEVFAATKGLYSGLVRGGQSKTKTNIYQSGNIVEAMWRSRLEEHLGVFTAEVVDSISGKVLHDKMKLQALLGLTSLLRKTLIDRNPYNDLYQHFTEFLRELPHSGDWLHEYVWMEIALLRYLGFGLDLSACAVTGKTVGLAYISPRTGCAVTREGAKGYEERLFALPKFLVEAGMLEEGDVAAALEITGYFISKNLFAPHERKMPVERTVCRDSWKRYEFKKRIG